MKKRNSSLVIALVGMCGSGKSSVAEILKGIGLEGVYFGKLTLDYLTNKKKPVNFNNERWARENLRKKKGMAAFAKLALPQIEQLLKKKKLIYIDGLYSLEEYEFLKKKLPSPLILIEIFLNKNERYQRLAKRKVRPLTLEQCQKRDMAEIKKLNKGGPIALADYKIENTSTTNDLREKIKKLIKKLI